MSPRTPLYEIFAFLLTAISTFYFDWKANELCWGLWVSSLLTGWAVILSSVLRILLHLAGLPVLRDEDLNIKGDPLSAYFRAKTFGHDLKDGKTPGPTLSPLLMVIGSIGIGAFTWLHFTFFHTIHAMLMSFFLQMEPIDLFGPNGFINADKGVVLVYLIEHYWPMILGTFLVRRGIIGGGNPGMNLKAIYGGVIRIHFFILLSAVLFFLVYFGVEIYQKVLLLILLLFFYVPFKTFRHLFFASSDASKQDET
ncbi:MAG: hypothetical protein N3G78_13545 [Desulfobacterota bacterium]|nr:hypothetical protein [Thermodesulfobacteriota bacterium]